MAGDPHLYTTYSIMSSLQLYCTLPQDTTLNKTSHNSPRFSTITIIWVTNCYLSTTDPPPYCFKRLEEVPKEKEDKSLYFMKKGPGPAQLHRACRRVCVTLGFIGLLSFYCSISHFSSLQLELKTPAPFFQRERERVCVGGGGA